jgi:DNA-binding NarL/FixJ family response regulator
MSKTRTTLTIDEGVLRAIKVRAARSGKGESEVIEEAVRRDLGLDLMDRLWSRNDLSEDEAMELATEAQLDARRSGPAKLGPGTKALTPREVELLQLLAKGRSTEELADRFSISQKTVKNHLTSIFKKLALADRTRETVEGIGHGSDAEH